MNHIYRKNQKVITLYSQTGKNKKRKYLVIKRGDCSIYSDNFISMDIDRCCQTMKFI